MMNKMKSARVHAVRFLFILPVVAVLLLAFRNRMQDNHAPASLLNNEAVFGVSDTTPKPPPPPPPPPVKLNEKGYLLSIADDNGECVVVIRDKSRKIIKAITLNEWNDHEFENAAKYGEIPPPPPPKKSVIRIRGKAANGDDTILEADEIIVEGRPIKTEEIMVNGYRSDNHAQSGSTNGNTEIVVRNAPSSLKEVVVVGYGTTKNRVEVEGEPLIVVDGVVMGKGVDLNKIIKPDEIKRIDVLKDLKAIEIYGEQAKDGVIVITRKDFKVPEDYKGIIVLDGEILPAGTDINKVIKNPNNIESITILKGNNAREKYGDKAKEGAILITTKKKESGPAVKVFGNGRQRALREDGQTDAGYKSIEANLEEINVTLDNGTKETYRLDRADEVKNFETRYGKIVKLTKGKSIQVLDDRGQSVKTPELGDKDLMEVKVVEGKPIARKLPDEIARDKKKLEAYVNGQNR